MKCDNCTHANVCKWFPIQIAKCSDFEEKRPRGEWQVNSRYNRRGKKFLNCSVCNYGKDGDICCEVSSTPNFCPNCGADMRPISPEGEL